VAWSDVQAVNSVPQSSLFRWSGSFASTPTFSTAASGEAFYFNNSQSLTTLLIPYRPSSSAISEQPLTPTLNLTAQREGRTTSLVRIGQRTDATADLDPYDQEAPPGYFETASLRLVHTAFDGQAIELAEEYRPTGEAGYRFDLLLRSEPGKRVILHPDLPKEFSGMELVLLDTQQGIRYYLSENGTISLSPETNESRFVLLIGDATYIAREQEHHLPEAYVLHPNYPNPFNPETTISYALPQDASVRVTVYDALGRQVRELYRGSQEAGYHQVVWDARSDSGVRVASGLYLYRLEAGSFTRVRSMLLLK
jgi:hypothetical protein